MIPRGADLSTLAHAHKSNAFEHESMERDPNVALPLDRLEVMAAEGMIKSVAPRHFSFMGSISAPARLVRRTAPSVARALRQDGVDVVLLTPV